MTNPDQPEKKKGKACGGSGILADPNRFGEPDQSTIRPCEDCSDRPADANKTMGEGPCRRIDTIHGHWAEALGFRVAETLFDGSVAPQSDEMASAEFNKRLFAWLSAKGWAAPDSVTPLERRAAMECHLRQQAEKELSALKEKAGMADKMSKVLAAFRRGKDKTLMDGLERAKHDLADELLAAYAKAENVK